MVMTMMSRETGQTAHHEISSYNAYTRYEVRDDKLYVTSSCGLLPEQRDLVVASRDELVVYLTTPPDVTGMCRHGHQIAWRCTEYGVWVCACYFEGLDVGHEELAQVPAHSRKRKERPCFR